MADEPVMTPVDGSEPPKASPLAKPVAATPKTLKLPPVRRPVAGATQTALKPGLRLPTKPGMPTAGLKLPTQTALKPGLKLPTQTALKPGLKMPTQTALKPGLKMPAKPVLRKPGSTVAATAIPKPVTATPKPVPPPVASAPAPTAAAPTPSPTTEPAPATVAPAPEPVAAAPEPKPVAPAPEPVAAAPELVPELPNPVEQLKKVTQKLKGITQQIPAQAVLRKTGIIADTTLTEGQKEAAKHKTARIALSDAMGVAPVKSENAPMKTIRIKRPIDIPGATSKKLMPIPPTEKPAEASANDVATSAATVEKPSEEKKTEPSTSITQRKTLKIARPGGGAVRPTGKFGIKRTQPTVVKSPADGSTAEAPAEGAAVADIPDIPDMPVAPTPVATKEVAESPAWLDALSSLVQAAACLAMGALAWKLFEAANTALF